MNVRSTNQQRYHRAAPLEQSSGRHRTSLSVFLAGLALTALAFSGTLAISRAQGGGGDSGYTSQFDLESCGFTTTGQNPYFILIPGYQLILEGEEDDEEMRVAITVLGDTEKIFLDDLGNVHTRVVEEREWVDGELAEVSRNFFAVCRRTNDVYYFGEDVDIYEDGEIVSHDGAWRAGQDGARPGIAMPGTFLLGSRYYQEVAPDVALDRAEHVTTGLTIETPAGLFTDAVQVLETTPLDPDEEGFKFYAPGVGLIVDEALELVGYGFIKPKHWPEE